MSRPEEMWCGVLPPRCDQTPLLGFARSPIIGGRHLALRFAGRIRRRVRHFHFAVRQTNGFHRQIVSTASASGVIGGNHDILQFVLHVLDGLVAGRATQRELDFGEMLPVGGMQHDFGGVVTHLRVQYKFVVVTLRDSQAAPPAATRGNRLRHAMTEGDDLDLLLKAGDGAVTVDPLHLTKDVSWHVLSPDDGRFRVDKSGHPWWRRPRMSPPHAVGVLGCSVLLPTGAAFVRTCFSKSSARLLAKLVLYHRVFPFSTLRGKRARVGQVTEP